MRILDTDQSVCAVRGNNREATRDTERRAGHEEPAAEALTKVMIPEALDYPA